MADCVRPPEAAPIRQTLPILTGGCSLRRLAPPVRPRPHPTPHDGYTVRGWPTWHVLRAFYAKPRKPPVIARTAHRTTQSSACR